METLKKVLFINAASSAATGFLLIVIPGYVANLFDVPFEWPFVFTGAFLVAFASLIAFVVFQKQLKTKLVNVIIALDVSWVLGSLLGVFMGGENLSTIGNILVLAVAGWVALMAYLQARYLNRGLTTLSSRPSFQ